jgi:hypothetical protein
MGSGPLLVDPEEWGDLLPDPPSAEYYRELAESRGHPWPWALAHYPQRGPEPEPEPSDAPGRDAP